jgi:hypothetical protein
MILEDEKTEKQEEQEVEIKIESTLSKEKRLECRQIVHEIKEFRVSQRQILYLIQLLALELEDREAMLSLINSVKATRDKISAPILELPTNLDF